MAPRPSSTTTTMPPGASSSPRQPPSQERAFILRYLYSTSSTPGAPTSSSSDQLPPLLPFGEDGRQAPRTPAEVELDHEAHLLLAQMLRSVIIPWYSKLTPDRELLSEIRQVLRHALQRLSAMFRPPSSELDDTDADAVRADEARKRLHRLLNFDLPFILAQHYRHVRRAEEVSYPNDETEGGVPGSCRAFVATEPHVALCLVNGEADGASSKLAVSPLYLSVLISSLLDVLLPPSHLESENERLVVRDVVVGILRGSVLGRVVKPWNLVGILNRALDGVGVDAGEEEERESGEGSQGESMTQESSSTLPALSLSTLRQSLSQAPSLLYLLISSLLPPLIRFYLGFFTPKALSQAASERSETRRRRAAAARRSENVSNIAPSAPATATATRHVRGHTRQSTGGEGYGGDEGELGIGTYGEELDVELESVAAQGEEPSVPEEQRGQASSLKQGAQGQGLGIEVAPLLELVKEVTELESTASGRQVSALVDFAMTLGGEKMASRLLTQRLGSSLSTELYLSLLRSIRLAALPNGNLPPPAPPDPDPPTQRREFERLVRRLTALVGNGPASYLLGFSASQRASRIARILGPVFAPPPTSSSSAAQESEDESSLRRGLGGSEEAKMSTAEVANVRTTLLILERVVLLLRPELQA